MVVRFVDIGGSDDHHFVKFSFQNWGSTSLSTDVLNTGKLISRLLNRMIDNNK